MYFGERINWSKKMVDDGNLTAFIIRYRYRYRLLYYYYIIIIIIIIIGINPCVATV
jgi:hypothetical protein